MLKHLSRLFRSNPTQPQERRRESSLALPDADVQLIVPMIKAVSVSEPQEPQTEIRLSFEQSPVNLPFAADTIIMYAVDRPNQLEYVSNETAAATGLTKEELHATSIKNLPYRLGQVQLHDCGQGVYGLSAGGNFEASLLLLDDLWHQLAQYFPGEPLAAIPSRDLLFVIGSARPNAGQLIAARARIELAEKRYAISQSVLVRKEGKWLAHTN
jgi:uncharacterized protein YtpQ (UPF0354 family)